MIYLSENLADASTNGELLGLSFVANGRPVRPVTGLGNEMPVSTLACLGPQLMTRRWTATVMACLW